MADTSFGNFEITSTRELDDTAAADSIFGGSPAANPDDISLLETPEEKPKPEAAKVDTKEKPKTDDKVEEKEPVETTSLEDTFLGDDTEVADPEKKTETPSANPDEYWFTSHAEDLIRLGIWSKPEDGSEIALPKSDEEVLERWQNELKSQAGDMLYNSISSAHGEEGELFYDYVFNKGMSPEEFSTRYAKIQSVQNLDLTVEGNQEALVRQYYTQQGWPADKINTKIQKLKDAMDLEDEASTAQEILGKHEATELQRAAAQKEAEKRQLASQKAQYDASVKRILADKLKTREFDGIPLTEKVVKETENNLLVEKYENTKTGETLTEFDKRILDYRRPENFEKKVKLWLLMEMMEKDPTFSTIKRKGVTEETSEIFKRSVTKDRVQSRTPASVKTDNVPFI